MKRVGLITLGEAPVPDMDEDIAYYFTGRGIEVAQFGALDGMSPAEIKALEPPEGGYVLTTELTNGLFVRLSKEKLVPLLQKCIERSEAEGIQVNIILCTSIFPEFNHREMLIEPGKLLRSIAAFLGGNNRIYAFSATSSHILQVKNKWLDVGVKLEAGVVQPFDYLSEDIGRLQKEFQDKDCIFLECAAYNRRFVRALSGFYKGLILCPLDLSFAAAADMLEQIP